MSITQQMISATGYQTIQPDFAPDVTLPPLEQNMMLLQTGLSYSTLYPYVHHHTSPQTDTTGTYQQQTLGCELNISVTPKLVSLEKVMVLKKGHDGIGLQVHFWRPDFWQNQVFKWQE